MSNLNQNFHPRLIINDHFDNIINKIDIKTETLLENQSLTEEKRNELNEIREKQIEKIKEIKEINLNLLQNEEEEEELEDLEKLIHIDCVILEHSGSINGYVMWITSWFYTQENLNFLR